MVLAGDDHYGQAKILTLEQAKLQLAVWGIVKAPLFIGGDVRTIDGGYLEALKNKVVGDRLSEGQGQREEFSVGEEELGKSSALDSLQTRRWNGSTVGWVS